MKRAYQIYLSLVLLAFAGLSAAQAAPALDRWWSPGDDRLFPVELDYGNSAGSLRVPSSM